MCSWTVSYFFVKFVNIKGHCLSLSLSLSLWMLIFLSLCLYLTCLPPYACFPLCVSLLHTCVLIWMHANKCNATETPPCTTTTHVSKIRAATLYCTQHSPIYYSLQKQWYNTVVPKQKQSTVVVTLSVEVNSWGSGIPHSIDSQCCRYIGRYTKDEVTHFPELFY